MISDNTDRCLKNNGNLKRQNSIVFQTSTNAAAYHAECISALTKKMVMDANAGKYIFTK